MIGAIFALLLGVAVAGGADLDPEARVEGAAVQVRLWLDAGELGRADALTRRGVVERPDDPVWHRLRLDTLHAAGMDAWIEAEYGRAGLSPAVAVVYAAWEVDVGRRLGLPAELSGPGVDVERARLALARGDAEPARALASEGDDPARLALRAALAVREDEATRAALIADWPSDASPAPLAPVLASGGRQVRRAREALLAAWDARLASGDALDALRVAELALALGDGPRLAAAAARMRELGVPTGLQAEVEALMAGPDGFDAWQVPERPRWSEAEIERLAAELAKQAFPKLPWARPDERERLATVLAERLAKEGRRDEADAVLVDGFGACAPVRRAEALIAAGRVREAREVAENLLFSCLGATDFTPRRDPAGLAVGVALDDVADAWFRFARAAEAAQWSADAAFAFAVAARLSPTAERVALARARAPQSKLPVDGSGLPTVEALLARLDEAYWLHPALRVAATRAERARARTAAWLDPTPERLAAAVTPQNFCLPTLRSRCQLERAVARAAFAEARLRPPEGLEVVDPGAELAGRRVLQRIREARFLRTAALARLIQAEVPRDLSAVLAGQTGVQVGVRAPRWSSGGLRAADLDGRVVVYLFWSGLNRQSASVIPALDAWAAQWEAEGLPVRVLAVSLDDDPKAYARALADLDWERVRILREPALRRLFDVQKLPHLDLVDATGVLRERRAGYGNLDLAGLDAAVRAFASQASRPAKE